MGALLLRFARVPAREASARARVEELKPAVLGAEEHPRPVVGHPRRRGVAGGGERARDRGAGEVEHPRGAGLRAERGGQRVAEGQHAARTVAREGRHARGRAKAPVEALARRAAGVPAHDREGLAEHRVVARLVRAQGHAAVARQRRGGGAQAVRAPVDQAKVARVPHPHVALNAGHRPRAVARGADLRPDAPVGAVEREHLTVGSEVPDLDGAVAGGNERPVVGRELRREDRAVPLAEAPQPLAGAGVPRSTSPAQPVTNIPPSRERAAPRQSWWPRTDCTRAPVSRLHTW